MEIVFQFFRQVIIDDPVDIVDIESSSSKVSGNEQFDIAVPERLKVLPAFKLVHISAVNGAIIAVLLQFFGESIALFAGVGEEQGTAVDLFFEDFLENVKAVSSVHGKIDGLQG